MASGELNIDLSETKITGALSGHPLTRAKMAGSANRARVKCDTFEIQKYRATEGYGISVTIVVSALMPDRWGAMVLSGFQKGAQPWGPADHWSTQYMLYGCVSPTARGGGGAGALEKFSWHRLYHCPPASLMFWTVGTSSLSPIAVVKWNPSGVFRCRRIKVLVKFLISLASFSVCYARTGSETYPDIE